MCIIHLPQNVSLLSCATSVLPLRIAVEQTIWARGMLLSTNHELTTGVMNHPILSLDEMVYRNNCQEMVYIIGSNSAKILL